MSETPVMPLDLNLDLNEVATGYPVLLADTYLLAVKSVEQVPSKTTPGGHNLLVTFVTTQNESTVAGLKAGRENDQAPGFPFKKWYPLQAPVDPASTFDFRKGLAELQDACTGTKQGERPLFNPAVIVETRVNAKIVITKSDEFGEGNDIKGISFPG